MSVIWGRLGEVGRDMHLSASVHSGMGMRKKKSPIRFFLQQDGSEGMDSEEGAAERGGSSLVLNVVVRYFRRI